MKLIEKLQKKEQEKKDQKAQQVLDSILQDIEAYAKAGFLKHDFVFYDSNADSDDYHVMIIRELEKMHYSILNTTPSRIEDEYPIMGAPSYIISWDYIDRAGTPAYETMQIAKKARAEVKERFKNDRLKDLEAIMEKAILENRDHITAQLNEIEVEALREEELSVTVRDNKTFIIQWKK